MKKDLSQELSKSELAESKQGALVEGVVFMDPRQVEELAEQKNFNFICRVTEESEAANFICKVEK